MRSSFLVFGKPYIGQEEINEVVDTIKSGWWGTGPKTEIFEKDFANYIGGKYSLAVNSATAGLHLALKVLGVSPGDEVITTPLTFCSTVNVILHCGAKPVFADVDINDWNIDPKEIEKKITKRTKVIMPVHLHGRPCEMSKIIQIARSHNLYVVEDAAHAVEAWYKGQKVGNIGDITVFSFYATKNVATGEGGMITTNNKKWIEKMKSLSLHGLSNDAFRRYSKRNFHIEDYLCVVPGFKYNMPDLSASLGIHQLRRINENAKVRKKYWKMYDEAFSRIPQLTVPKREEVDTVHARHLYAILLKLEELRITRNEFLNLLIDENIGSGIHFIPVHLHPYYRKTYGFTEGDFPNAEFIGQRTISLPLAANLSTKDIEDVIKAVKEIIDLNKKT